MTEEEIGLIADDHNWGQWNYGDTPGMYFDNAGAPMAHRASPIADGITDNSDVVQEMIDGNNWHLTPSGAWTVLVALLQTEGIDAFIGYWRIHEGDNIVDSFGVAKFDSGGQAHALGATVPDPIHAVEQAELARLKA